MKAITLTQPFATLVAIGAKQIETRSWRTDYRGPLAIHAAAGLGPVGGQQGLMELCRTEPFRSALIAAGYLGTPGLPLGQVVATCRLVDCIPTSDVTARFGAYGPENEAGGRTLWPLSDQELAFGNYSTGRYAWLLADIQLLATPITARGALGLWDWYEG